METTTVKNKLEYIDGNLITFAKEGKFDVIAHGCNCFCKMKSGIAPQMADAFGCDTYDLENPLLEGNYNKLGQIDFEEGIVRSDGRFVRSRKHFTEKRLTVVNCYTQFDLNPKEKPFDYVAFRLCMRKMAYYFRGLHIGLPKIGAGLAGGSWVTIERIIEEELLPHCKVTIVNYVQE